MRRWEKPRLIILVKVRPEEAVLTGCKRVDMAGPGVYDIACTMNPFCVDCSSPASS